MPESKQIGQQYGQVRHAIDVDALNAYIKKDVPAIAGPVDVKQFSYGQSNPTYVLFDQNQKRYVLRKKPQGELMSATAHAIEREYRILKALSNFNKTLPANSADAVPVPEVFCLCEDKGIVGTNFYIMEFIQGRIFADIRMLPLPKDERRQCWFSAMRTLAALHRLDPSRVGLADYGKDRDFYTRQMKSLGKVSSIQAKAKDRKTGQETGEVPGIDRFLQWFAANMPSDENTLIHGDYKIDNLIFHPTEPRVIGLLDWELSTRGHPLSDLANLLQQFSLPCSNPAGINDEGEVDRARERGELLLALGDLPRDVSPVPTKDELIRVYCDAVARPFPIPSWEAAESWAWFRLAVITQGIAARNAQGQASSAQAQAYGSKFPHCAKAMFQIVDKANAGGGAPKPKPKL
ncbi:uncharacterized protein PFL1_04826 [Pseudozyma flocculosa PF-1]|uniref:Related to Phosphotransferase enzyme family domain protein n=2 Tax=Pseudozyma flocculosa TaxID=84751 RepID=A0A5C3F6W0_9BASI|nr:uncharacterized protein PFL1_04826 [Pseudozyma flocculosa PF-1]EPQ27688.1 hypothetical protein PFL1_04826 [Pseudozyma flocculosa PF-1]SPO39179.1 related to Phosphotransferase enzyme family domain protein [Pseudozyma flocculosa]